MYLHNTTKLYEEDSYWIPDNLGPAAFSYAACAVCTRITVSQIKFIWHMRRNQERCSRLAYHRNRSGTLIHLGLFTCDANPSSIAMYLKRYWTHNLVVAVNVSYLFSLGSFDLWCCFYWVKQAKCITNQSKSGFESTSKAWQVILRFGSLRLRLLRFQYNILIREVSLTKIDRDVCFPPIRQGANCRTMLLVSVCKGCAIFVCEFD